jgi:hypothetical protein
VVAGAAGGTFSFPSRRGSIEDRCRFLIKARQPRQRVRPAGNHGAEDQRFLLHAVEDEEGKRAQVPTPKLTHNLCSRLQEMPGPLRRGFDGIERILKFVAEAHRQTVRDGIVIRLELPDVLWKVRVLNDSHRSAEQNCSSERPAVRPAAMSSIRRIPSATASFSTADVTTLSTSRRANSRRSSAGRSSTVLVISAGSMEPRVQLRRPDARAERKLLRRQGPEKPLRGRATT